MVSFRPAGRLGNFLFTAAAAYVYSLQHGLEFSMPSTTNDPKWNPIYLPELINSKFISGREDVLLKEPDYFKYEDLPFQESWRGSQIVFDGYFQNPKYFENYREEILKLFNFESAPKNGYVSIHVRRGDYLTLTEKHPPVPVSWIINAMNMLYGYKYLFFSDDIQWCKATFGHRNDCEFSEGRNELQDLIEMSKCEHFINSASTFSWWGAWLSRNSNKTVIVPKTWLMPAHSNQYTEEIVPKEWIRI